MKVRNKVAAALIAMSVAPTVHAQQIITAINTDDDRGGADYHVDLSSDVSGTLVGHHMMEPIRMPSPNMA